MLVTRGLGIGPLLPTFGLGTLGTISLQDTSLLVLPLFADIANLEAFVFPTNNPATHGFDINSAVCETDSLVSIIQDIVKDSTKVSINKELAHFDTDINTAISAITHNVSWVDPDANNAVSQIFSSNTLIN